MSDYQMLRWAVGDEQVDRAFASVIDLGPMGREHVVRRLAAGETIDAAGVWTIPVRRSAKEIADELAALESEWIDAFRPCEALASRDPGRAS